MTVTPLYPPEITAFLHAVKIHMGKPYPRMRRRSNKKWVVQTEDGESAPRTLNEYRLLTRLISGEGQ